MTTTSATPSRTSSTTTNARTTTPSTPSTPTEAAVRAGSSALMKGHSGPAVTSLQERLNRAGTTPPLAADGTFGDKTRAAIERFQQQHNLPVDGKVGARTLAALEAATPTTTPTSPGSRATPADSLERGGGTSSGRSAPAAPSTPAPTTATPRRGLAASTTRTTETSTPTLPAGVDAPARATITAALNGSNGPEARTALTTLMANAQFRGLAAPAQARLLTSVHASASGSLGLIGALVGGGGDTETIRGRQITHAANQANALLQSTASRTGSAADRARLVDVHAASPSGRAALLALAGQNGGPNRLAGRDLRGGTMLAHLSTMATQPLAAGINRNDMLASTMSEVRDPSTIEQRGIGTCAATSVSLQVMTRSPGEYVRLLTGLSGRAGTTTLANGDTLRRLDESITDTATRRSISERLLQSSFMDYADSGDRYSIATNHGLTASEIARLQSGVFNEQHHVVGTSGRYARRDATIRERTWLGLKNAWETVTFRRDAEHPMEVLRERTGTPTTVAMRWGTAADSNHAVLVMRTENGRVYFQNPHGNAGNTVGQSLTPPPRRVEQGNVQSMTTADFERRLFAVSVPG